MTRTYPLGEITARAHAKVNLQLGVGPARPDGFHELATVFQSLSLADTVRLTGSRQPRRPGDGPVASLSVSGSVLNLETVPRNQSNLAWRAVEAVVAASGNDPVEAVHIHIEKGIPVAGGMAGGSADAAAALVAANLWMGNALSDAALLDLAATLGSDVPFTLRGRTALGTGRGEQLVPVLSRGEWWWVVALSARGLSTPSVFRALDELRASGQAKEPHLDTTAVLSALAAGDQRALARALVNDLQEPALRLRPDLRRTLELGTDAGALAGIVSGSGPTCAFLCSDAAHANEVAEELLASGLVADARVASGPAEGTTLV